MADEQTEVAVIEAEQPAEAQPSQRSFTEAEVTQILREQITLAKAQVQQGHGRTITAMQQRIDGLEARLRSADPELETLVAEYPELAPRITSIKERRAVEVDREALKARETTVALTEVAQANLNILGQWAGFLAQEIKTNDIPQDEANRLMGIVMEASQNPLSWERGNHDALVAELNAAKKIAAATKVHAKEKAKLEKELGKVNEEKELGTPVPIEGGGKGPKFTLSQLGTMDVFEKARRAKEIAKAFEEGAVSQE